MELLVAGENVEPALLAEVSELAHPPRVIAVYRRGDLPRGTRAATLALWHVGDPGNVGTLLRAADAFGAGIALSEGCADPTGPKALRASAGSIFRVPVGGFDEPAGRRIALVARGGEPLGDMDLAGEVVFVLGAEREGLPDDVAETHGRWLEREPGIFERADWDMRARTLTLSVRDANASSTMTLSWISPPEWRRLLAKAGLEVEACYGWFDRKPYSGGEDTVWIAHVRK